MAACSLPGICNERSAVTAVRPFDFVELALVRDEHHFPSTTGAGDPACLGDGLHRETPHPQLGDNSALARPLMKG